MIFLESIYKSLVDISSIHIFNSIKFIAKKEKLLYNKNNFFGKSIFYRLNRESMVGGNTL